MTKSEYSGSYIQSSAGGMRLSCLVYWRGVLSARLPDSAAGDRFDFAVGGIQAAADVLAGDRRGLEQGLQFPGLDGVETAGMDSGYAGKGVSGGSRAGTLLDVELSPLGADAIRPLIESETGRGPFGIEAAQRTLEGITGISKAGNAADVEFTWHWAPLNQVGAAAV